LWLGEGRALDTVAASLKALVGRSPRGEGRARAALAEIDRLTRGALEKGLADKQIMKGLGDQLRTLAIVPDIVREQPAPAPEDDPLVQRVQAWKPLDPKTVKPVEFYVEGLIEKRRAVGLVAPGGTGKTTTLLKMGIAGALNRAWFGMPVEQGVFVLLSKDDTQEDLEGAMSRVVEAEGLSEREAHAVYANVRLISLLGVVGSSTFAEERAGGVVETQLTQRLLTALAPIKNLRCVALDTVRQFAGADTNSNRVMTIMTQALVRVGHELGCVVIGPHHMTKEGARSKEVDQYMGSGGAAFGDNLRVILGLAEATLDELRSAMALEPLQQAGLTGAQILKLTDTRGSLRRVALGTIWLSRRGFDIRRIEGRKLGPKERAAADAQRVVEVVERGATSIEAVRTALGVNKAKAMAMVNAALAAGLINRKGPKRGQLGVPDSNSSNRTV
jgi:hypothetical protein